MQIAEYIRDSALRRGDHLTEFTLAEALGVSRTPVRPAMEYLASLDIVEPNGPRRGFTVKGSAAGFARLERDGVKSDDEALYVKLAEDFGASRLADQFSEADLMKRYGVSRGLLLRVLQRLAHEQVIVRNQGYRWRFSPRLRSIEAHDESYRFRLVVEPAGLLEPTFVFDRAWAARCRREHEAILATRPERVSIVRFFEINADFHESLAACSGNQFLHQAVQVQNQLRKFLSYNWSYGLDRIAASCQEHMAILNALENDKRDVAATLMRRHLKSASRLKPESLAPTSDEQG
jgi:DNA-binding GntR family transcriptional regulator